MNNQKLTSKDFRDIVFFLEVMSDTTRSSEFMSSYVSSSGSTITSYNRIMFQELPVLHTAIVFNQLIGVVIERYRNTDEQTRSIMLDVLGVFKHSPNILNEHFWSIKGYFDIWKEDPKNKHMIDETWKELGKGEQDE